MSINKALTLVVMSAFSASAIADTSVRDVQNTLREWVRVEKQISEEKTNWLLEKEILTDSIRVMEETKTRLSEAIAAASQTASAAELARNELSANRESLRETARIVGAAVDEFEKNMLQLVQRLPDPLKKEIDILVRRMPTDAESAARMSLAVRMQNLVGILNQIDKWNSSVSVVNEVQTLDNGAREVRTLYFGLGTAFYVDGTGTVAGYAVPGPTGWTWVSEPSLASTITRLIAVYDNTIPAVFVGLPAQIR